MKHWDVVIPPYEAISFYSLTGEQIQDWGHAYLNASLFYRVTRGENACIFILDTAGVFDHPDLKENNLVELNKNFTDSPTMSDVHGHGTHVAGIANAVDNAFGVIGIAPGAKLAACKVLNDQGAGSYGWIASAIRYVADLDISYRKVISMSLGGPSPSDTLLNAIHYAIEKGCFIVAAAGNRGYKEGVNTIDWPGRYEKVITVASIGIGENPSSFSSAGPEIDLAAPGEKVYSTHKNGGYALLSGTSMATPQVAGLCALVVSAYPHIENQEDLERFLEENAKDIFDPGEDWRTGAGAPTADRYMKEDPPPEDPEEPKPTPMPKLTWWAWVLIGLTGSGVLFFLFKLFFSQ